MKKYYILIFLVGFSFCFTYAQNVGIGTSTPDASAKLDISSTDKGVLIPRVSLSDVTVFGLSGTTLTEGMIVYNTNAAITGGYGVGFYFWKGGQWFKINDGKPAWELTGNTATDETVNYMGTTDNHDVVFKRNNVEQLRFDNQDVVVNQTGADIDFLVEGDNEPSLIATDATGNGAVGIGTAAPNTRLNVDAEASQDIFRLQRNGTTEWFMDANGNTRVGSFGAPSAGALIDMNVTDEGLLVPRLTTAQRDAMPLKSEGLLIYNTTNDCFEYWDTKASPGGAGGFWNSLCKWCEEVVIISTNQTGFNLNTYIGGAKARNYCVYINSGVTLQAATNGGGLGVIGNPGFDATSMPAGSSVTLYNYGTILAGGGNGGRGGQESDGVCQGDANGGNGGRGGNAIHTNANVPITVYNYGVVNAGGGGGGGGGASCCAAGGGGGGGAGTPVGIRGTGNSTRCASGFICGCGTSSSGAGINGTATTGGNGGGGVNRGSTSCTCTGSGAGTGGRGGNRGAAGSIGGGTTRRGNGGAAGKALEGSGSGSSFTNIGGTNIGGITP